ncbi:hypothetical protein ISN45_Aa07g018180 [Arabidopsis thaliana x Arabidopsis arenosa]|uniref:Uncharacterized protein n=1 Tax=Arabidopsis thaliana x Arabidopsis arenosa TaxID=1240361 RepID=A0A8T1Y3F3_9BRAS|nr:hypothetical protein ISN45_Aa07g018180 [Arabidopsis thaliana x Arabidopsis arenosa]
MSLNYHHNNICVREQVPKENLVSTGLRLSYDDDDRNSSVTSASGSIVAASPIFDQSLHVSLRIDLNRQKDELDQFIKVLIVSACALFLPEPHKCKRDYNRNLNNGLICPGADPSG